MPLDQYEELPEGEKEMSFIDHLEELRWHIIRAFAAILLFTIIAFIAKDIIFGIIILGPSKPDFITYRLFCEWGNQLHIPSLCIDKLNFTLQSRQMTGQFMMHITSSFIVGLVVAFPYVVWEIWTFIKPGLYFKEQNATRGVVFFITLLFLLGIGFGYFVISPMSINFLANYQIDSSIVNQFDITSYVSILVMMVLASGLMFQLPMIVWVLTKIGILTPAFMRNFRKHSIIVILIISALITPSPDVFSQMLVAIPLYGLYEISILISDYEIRKQRKAEFEEDV
jgi:sec-independent protein translocase protein TatC